MKRLPYLLIPVLFACLANQAVLAQGFSYDGNRWYELEVSIFSHENGGSSNEQVITGHIDLSYPELILLLEPAVSSFMVDFAPDNPLPVFQSPALQPQTPAETVLIGPETPPGESDFRLTDFSRDPYIALGSDEAEFSEYNRDIERSPDHRLLFHAVWRQPVLNQVQATAIFVSGGDQYGRHHELEGSLRFSFNVNRVDVEARLWLATFSAFAFTNAGNPDWQLPDPPFKTGDETLTLELPVTDIGYMDQVRPMISNELHYLDHPDFGMLVQIRPYELPQPTNFAFE